MYSTLKRCWLPESPGNRPCRAARCAVSAFYARLKHLRRDNARAPVDWTSNTLLSVSALDLVAGSSSLASLASADLCLSIRVAGLADHATLSFIAHPAPIHVL